MAEIPKSAIESAVHQENQTAKEPDPKGALENLRELWGSVAEPLVAAGVQFVGEKLSGIGAALEHIGRDALAGVQRETHVMFFGKADLGHVPEPKPGIHGELAPSPTPVAAIEPAQPSFSELMKEQAAMLPQRDEPGPEQEHDPNGPER